MALFNARRLKDHTLENVQTYIQSLTYLFNDTGVSIPFMDAISDAEIKKFATKFGWNEGAEKGTFLIKKHSVYTKQRVFEEKIGLLGRLIFTKFITVI